MLTQRKNERTEGDEDRRTEKYGMDTDDLYTEQVKTRIAHREYLEGCYRRQIGLPLAKKQRINIYSYTDHRVARGTKRW